MTTPQFAEYWEDFGDWVASGVQLNKGYLYGVPGGNPAGAVHNAQIGTEFRYRGLIRMVPNGTASGLTMIGLSVGPVGAGPSGANLIAVGFDQAGRPCYYRGSAVGGNGLYSLSSTPQLAGWFWVTISIDSQSVCMTISNSDGTAEWRALWKRNALPPLRQIAVWNSDARGLAGSSIGPVGYRESAQPLTDAPRIEGQAPSLIWNWDPQGNFQHIALPAGYDGVSPLPLVIYTHGSSGTEMSVFDRDVAPIQRALLAAGFAVASHSQHGNNWGNDQSVQDIKSLYDYVNTRWLVEGGVYLLAQSMGGLSSLLAAANKVVPVTAWAGIYPVTNLQAVWEDVRLRSYINSSYGVTTWTANMAENDPNQLDPKLFDGLLMKFYASPDDTIVRMVENTGELVDRLSSHALIDPVNIHVGDHGDPTAFDPQGVLEFFDWCRYVSL